MQLAFNVVAQSLLGSRLDSGKVNDSLREDFFTLTEGLFALPINLPGTKFRKAIQARAHIIETLEKDVVNKPRPSGDEDHYADYMEYMRKENLPGTTEELLLEMTQCHVLGMLFAGHETVACTMLFAVKYIMDHPRVLDELRAEHANIQASKFEGGPLTWDDYKNMRFTQHVSSSTKFHDIKSWHLLKLVSNFIMFHYRRVLSGRGKWHLSYPHWSRSCSIQHGN
jgi:cytochrome P450